MNMLKDTFIFSFVVSTFRLCTAWKYSTPLKAEIKPILKMVMLYILISLLFIGYDKLYAKVDVEDFIGEWALSFDKKCWYLQQINQCSARSLEALEEADKLCWYLPDYDAKTGLRNAIKAALPSFVCCTPKVAALIVAATLATDYADRCLDEYLEIQRLLRIALYEAEKAESFKEELVRLANLRQFID